jgi:hypothetical protein
MSIIAVLEDDPRRIAAMRTAARTHLVDYDVRIFVSAREMIDWLADGAQDVRLISLDCDLDSAARGVDTCGSGEDVTEYLVCNLPDCPVLIHSSNAMRAPAMHLELVLAGCKRVHLCPFQDSNSWATDVRAQLAAG